MRVKPRQMLEKCSKFPRYSLFYYKVDIGHVNPLNPIGSTVGQLDLKYTVEVGNVNPRKPTDTVGQ